MMMMMMAVIVASSHKDKPGSIDKPGSGRRCPICRSARTTSHEDNKPRTDGAFSTAGPLGRREPQRPPGQAVASRLREAAYVGWAVTTERASERASQRCWPEREREQKKTGPHGVLVLLLLLLDTFDIGARFYWTERWEIKSRNKFTTKGSLRPAKCLKRFAYRHILFLVASGAPISSPAVPFVDRRTIAVARTRLRRDVPAHRPAGSSSISSYPTYHKEKGLLLLWTNGQEVQGQQRAFRWGCIWLPFTNAGGVVSCRREQDTEELHCTKLALPTARWRCGGW
uniref:Uncharacterized protein n=1 Tax=Anopheles coluzzii TaxID=1518534 RepID=A0A8W7PVF2_ANOCL